MPATLTFIDNPQPSPVSLRAARALAASIFLHGLLLLLFLGQGARFVDMPAQRGLTVMLPMRPPAFVTPDDRQTLLSAETATPRSFAADQSLSQQANADIVAASQPSLSGSAESERTSTAHIDIDAVYGIARQAARTSRNTSASVRIEAVSPVAQEIETQLGRSVSKAARPDCRTAHAGLGLFALPFLIADAITDRGCKW